MAVEMLKPMYCAAMGRPSYSDDLQRGLHQPDGQANGAASSASGVRPSALMPALPPAPRLPMEAKALRDRDQASHLASRSDLAGALESKTSPSVPPRRSLPSLPPPVAQLGRYAVLGRLAMGGMAEIYLAREGIESGGQRHAAIKVLRRNKAEAADEGYFEELFLREGRTASQLVHPNICHVYEFGKSGGHFYIAMEWIDGVSLFQLSSKLAESGRTLPATIAVNIAAQVAGALDYAHHARDARRKPLAVVHRDVNPYNIMLRHDGGVKLLDFGVAQVADPQEDSRTDTVKGKLGYMAPEQAMQEPLDGRADVFALGVCLHEMLTGKRLYRRDSMRQTMAAVLREPAPALRTQVADIPERLEAIVQRALAKKASERFQSAGELQAALEAYLADSGEIVSSRRIAQLMESVYPEAQTRAPALYTGDEVATRLVPLEDTQRALAARASHVVSAPRPRALLPWALLIVVAMIAVVGWAAFLRAPTPRAPSPLQARAATPVAIPAASYAVELAPAAQAPVDEVRSEQPSSEPSEPSSNTPESRGPRRRASPRFVADPGF